MLRDSRKGLGSCPTPTALATLQEKRNLLYRRIDSWRKVQERYMPSVTVHRLGGAASAVNPASHDSSLPEASSSVTVPPQVEDLDLLLPSSLAKTGALDPDTRALAITESRLRVAQGDDALIELRKRLRIRQALFQYKKLHVTGTGQRPNTRARAIISQQTHKIDRCAEKYRAARAALVSLDPGGDWETRLQPLRGKDIRHPSEREEGQGEGHRVTPWIWLVSASRCPDGEVASDDEVDQSLRVEWAKSFARAERWSEEVKLLAEEMRRVVAFLSWKQSWWTLQADRRKNAVKDLDGDLHSGLEGYALKQADTYRRLAISFTRKWVSLLRGSKLPCAWCDAYLEPTENCGGGFL